jgi:hypothetical protein
MNNRRYSKSLFVIKSSHLLLSFQQAGHYGKIKGISTSDVGKLSSFQINENRQLFQ